MNLLKQEAAHVTATGNRHLTLKTSSRLVKFESRVEGHLQTLNTVFKIVLFLCERKNLEKGDRFICCLPHGCPSLKVLSNESMTIIRTYLVPNWGPLGT